MCFWTAASAPYVFLDFSIGGALLVFVGDPLQRAMTDNVNILDQDGSAQLQGKFSCHFDPALFTLCTGNTPLLSSCCSAHSIVFAVWGLLEQTPTFGIPNVASLHYIGDEYLSLMDQPQERVLECHMVDTPAVFLAVPWYDHCQPLSDNAPSG